MPHLLDGCWAKIQRAEESIGNLNREITAFLSGDPPPYKIVREHQDNGLKYAFMAYAEPVPLRFSVLAGEIVHHLRSSLDHLIYALIVKGGGTPTNNNQFPIYLTPEEFDRACNSGLIKGIPRSAKKLIRSVQPYTSPTPEYTILYVVHQYDILDKHRLLVVTCTVAEIGHQIIIGPDETVADQPTSVLPNIVGLGDPVPRRVTKDGVEVFSIRLAAPAPQFQANANFVPQIAFEKCGGAEIKPVIEALSMMLEGIAHTVRLFAGEF